MLLSGKRRSAVVIGAGLLLAAAGVSGVHAQGQKPGNEKMPAIGQGSALADTEAPEIGTTIDVVNKVEIFTGQDGHALKKGAKIHTQEKVVTGNKASSQFKLSDNTNLAVGPNAELLLDKFVYDPNPNKRKVVLKSFKGAMRFVTGNNPSKTYEIRTPTATIGIRGTMIDIYVGSKGRTVVGLLKGRIRVCKPGSRRCKGVRRPGRFLRIDRRGRISITTDPRKFFNGVVPFAAAFPFISGRTRLGGVLLTPNRLRLRILGRAGLPIVPKVPGLNKFNNGIPGLDLLLNADQKARGKKAKSRKQKRRKNKRRKRKRGGLKLKLPF